MHNLIKRVFASLLLVGFVFAQLTGGVHAAETPQELYADIKTYLAVPVQSRDFGTLLKKTESLYNQYPESDAADLMLNTIERWYESKLISEEQFIPFKKHLEESRKTKEAAITFAKHIGSRYQYLVETNTLTVSSSQELVNACLEELKKPDISRTLRCNILAMLARVHFETGQHDRFQKYAGMLLAEKDRREGLDFPGGSGLEREILELKLEGILQQSGQESAAKFWREHFRSSGNDIESDIRNHRCFIQMLDKHCLSPSGKQPQEAAALLAALLNKLIEKYPDSKHPDMLDYRLRLGVLTLNRDMSGDTISGIMTPERLNEISTKRKENAEKAESMFRAVRDLGKGTPYEQIAERALADIEQAKNPVMLAVDEPPIPLPETTAADYARLRFVLLANLLFIALLLVIYFRYRITQCRGAGK